MTGKQKKPYGLKLLLSPSRLFKSRHEAQTQIDDQLEANKKAIAIVVYQDYHAVIQIRNAIRMQGLGLDNDGLGFDIGVFQDGLKEDDEASVHAYNQTAVEALQLIDKNRFVRQEKHLGHDLHLAEIEKFLFEDLNYDLVVFLDNPDISPKYFEQLGNVFETLNGDSRIAALSISHDNSVAHQMVPSGQTIGLMRHAWLASKPILDAYSYIHSLSLPDYQQQLVADWWASNLGFKGINLNRSDARRSAHAALKLAEVAATDHSAQLLSDVDYQTIVLKQAEHYLKPGDFDYQQFEQKLARGDIHVDPSALLSATDTSIHDMMAAYKFFLKRLPENFQVVESRIGIPADLMFQDFLLSDEFLSHEDYWPAVIEAAKKVIALNNLKNASDQASELEAGVADDSAQPKNQ